MLDNSAFYYDPSTPINWLDIGRQGGVFTRFIFESFEELMFGLNYNPYFVIAVSAVILVIILAILSQFINSLTKLHTKYCFLISLIFLIHPIWVEQIYYTFQILPIIFALLLTIMSAMLHWEYINDKVGICKLVCSIILVKNKRIYIALFACIILVSQCSSTFRAIYTYDTNLQKNLNIMEDLNDRILYISNQNNVKNPKIAIVGLVDDKINMASKKGEVISINNFNFLATLEPRYSKSLNWSYRLLKIDNPQIKRVNEQELWQARIEAQNMPSWPLHDSIKLINDDVIVIKLSNDPWFKKDLNARSKQ